MKKLLSKVGMGLLVLAMTVNSMTLVRAATSGLGNHDVDLSDALPGNILVQEDPMELIKNVVNLIFIVAAALTFFYLVFGAIQWITSGGDKGKVEDARNKITAAVIGLLILAATWAIFSLIIGIAFGTNGDWRVPSLLNS